MTRRNPGVLRTRRGFDRLSFRRRVTLGAPEACTSGSSQALIQRGDRHFSDDVIRLVLVASIYDLAFRLEPRLLSFRTASAGPLQSATLEPSRINNANCTFSTCGPTVPSMR